jgi:hypothetical protein
MQTENSRNSWERVNQTFQTSKKSQQIIYQKAIFLFSLIKRVNQTLETSKKSQ